jgi:hypothetical protein
LKLVLVGGKGDSEWGHGDLAVRFPDDHVEKITQLWWRITIGGSSAYFMNVGEKRYTGFEAWLYRFEDQMVVRVLEFERDPEYVEEQQYDYVRAADDSWRRSEPLPLENLAAIDSLTRPQ